MWRQLTLLGAVAAVASCLASAQLQPELAEGAGSWVRLGALFAVHGAPAGVGARCGTVREHYGIQRVEATLQALDEVAAGAVALAPLRLAAELRDSCWAPPTALRQTIDLVRDAIAPPQRSPQAHTRTCQKPSGTGSAEGGALLGVLGPGASAAAVHVQNLLQLFSIPQVSYSATSRELSDRARFSTFFRVVPSDRHQARLLVQLLRAHNWTYVHAVHTDESYGQSGMAAFREEAARGGVCIAREEALRAAPTPGEVSRTLQRLSTEINVCVCWCEGRTARALLAGLAAQRRRLQLVASDGWADRQDVVEGLESAARHALTVRIRSPYLKHFDTYYHALKPHTNTRNPWFQEFWEHKFNCSLAKEQAIGIKKCTGSESLSSNYTQEPKLALVVRGVYAMAHALRDMISAECHHPFKPPAGLCARLLPFNVSLYTSYLAKVRFRAPDGGLVAFDDNGDPPAELSEYDVMRLVGNAERGWRYQRVGRWRRGALILKGGDNATLRRAEGIRAQCSRACAAGWWARAGGGAGGGADARCCWTCVPCAPLAVTTLTPPGCRLCAPGRRPDAARARCLPSPVEWGTEARWVRAVAGITAGAGLAVAALCAAVFWRHRRTPVVKSASRELCALLLGSAALCNVSALAAVARPAPLPCALVRLAAPALSGVYAAVVARTVRIARLVALSERCGGSARLLSSRAQLAAWGLLTAPGAAAALWGALAYPPMPELTYPGRARAVLVCGGTRAAAQLAPLAPALVLLAASVALAVRTRKLPHNLNETRFIGAAAYTTCVTWAAFLPLYTATGGAEWAGWAGVCGAAAGAGGAVLALSLGARVWVMALRPERNTRAHFLTAASIRCHLGQYRPGKDAQPSPIRRRDVGSQAGSTPGSGPGAACPAAAPCARVTLHPRGPDAADVLIVLLPHHHAPPDDHLALDPR